MNENETVSALAEDNKYTEACENVGIADTAEAVDVLPVESENACAELDEPTDGMDTARTPRGSGFLGLVLLKALPWSLAAISIIVPITLFSVLISDFDVSFAGISRLLLGDMAGGIKNITVVEMSSPDSGMTAVPPPETESETYTAEKKEDAEDSFSPSVFALSNETPYEPNMEEILTSPRAVLPLEELYAEYGDGAPVVLIIHTHATEGFSDTAEENYRTTDSTRNVIALGKIIKEKLEAAGINAVHCTDMLDTPDFNMAYYSASQKIREYISAYPSISYVLDIHRDSIQLEDGSYYSPTAKTTLGDAAQIMFVVGTDHGGSGHAGWQDNLSLAARLQKSLAAEHPSLMRSINLRSASFNEQYTKGSLLIEIGACASDFDEVELSAEILADHLAREIIG